MEAVYGADPHEVRAELLRVLAKVRAARSPVAWDARRTLYWRTVFPQMTSAAPEARRRGCASISRPKCGGWTRLDTSRHYGDGVDGCAGRPARGRRWKSVTVKGGTRLRTTALEASASRKHSTSWGSSIIAGPGGTAAASCSEGRPMAKRMRTNCGNQGAAYGDPPRRDRGARQMACPGPAGLDGLLHCCADERLRDLGIPASPDQTRHGALMRRSQRHRLTSSRMKTIADRYLPPIPTASCTPGQRSGSLSPSKVGARCVRGARRDLLRGAESNLRPYRDRPSRVLLKLLRTFRVRSCLRPVDAGKSKIPLALMKIRLALRPDHRIALLLARSTSAGFRALSVVHVTSLSPSTPIALRRNLLLTSLFVRPRPAGRRIDRPWP